jgi:hypothetical protein
MMHDNRFPPDDEQPVLIGPLHSAGCSSSIEG